LRKALNLTQQEFANRIGSVQNTITGYETGRRIPSSQVLTLICREFNVNETWLRTGEGGDAAMFAPEPAFNLADYAKRHGMTALETEILKAYLDLDPAWRETLLLHFKERLAKGVGHVRTQPDATAPEQTQPDIAAKLAELERQNQELAAKVAAMEEEDAEMEAAEELLPLETSDGAKTG